MHLNEIVANAQSRNVDITITLPAADFANLRHLAQDCGVSVEELVKSCVIDGCELVGTMLQQSYAPQSAPLSIPKIGQDTAQKTAPQSALKRYKTSKRARMKNLRTSHQRKKPSYALHDSHCPVCNSKSPWSYEQWIEYSSKQHAMQMRDKYAGMYLKAQTQAMPARDFTTHDRPLKSDNDIIVID